MDKNKFVITLLFIQFAYFSYSQSNTYENQDYFGQFANDNQIHFPTFEENEQAKIKFANQSWVKPHLLLINNKTHSNLSFKQSPICLVKSFATKLH